jgi:hypothetical protein
MIEINSNPKPLHMYFKDKLPGFVIFILSVLLITGCAPEPATDSETEEEKLKSEVEKELEENIKKAKKVFYSLPSPLETAILFRHAGASYDKEILNPLDNVSKYTTNKSMALNLGIYSADLSYASLFDQTQTSIKYMAAAKKMAEGLGIIDAIDKDMIDKLEQNINNKAVVMDIISQAYVNSNSSLKQNDRAAIASIMLVGGWVEGLYIATQLTKSKATDNELVDRIIDQRLPLKSIINLLEAYKDHPDVADVIQDVYEIQQIFDKISVKSTRVTPVVDSGSNVTTLKSKVETSMSQEVFNQLCNKVEEIRNSYIN